MAKRWVNARFKSKHDAIDYCASGNKIKKECGREVIFIPSVNKFIARGANGINLFIEWEEIWSEYENMMIEIDEPELEVGKLYQVSDFRDFRGKLNLSVFKRMGELGRFVNENECCWAYYREIPAELIGKIK